MKSHKRLFSPEEDSSFRAVGGEDIYFSKYTEAVVNRRASHSSEEELLDLGKAR